MSMADDRDLVSIGSYAGGGHKLVPALATIDWGDAIMEFGGDPEPELYDLLDELTASRAELAEANRRSRCSFKVGPITFGIGPAVLPLEGNNLHRVVDLMHAHGDLGVIEVGIVDSDGRLLYAPDALGGEIWVSGRLPQAIVDALHAALHDDLQPPPDKGGP